MSIVKETSKTYNFKTRYVFRGTEVEEDKVLTFKRHRTGELLPNYRQVIKDKGNATTPLVAYEQLLVNSYVRPFQGIDNLVTAFPHITSTKFNFEAFEPIQSVPSYLVDEAVAAATSRAYKKIGELTDPFKGQVFLGELKETLQLLKNPLAKSIQLTNAFLRKRKAADKNFRKTKALGESWLEYRFGILPLIQDIGSLLELAQKQAQRNETLSYRFYGKSEGSSSDVLLSNDMGFDVSISVEEVYKAECIINLGFNQSLLNVPSEFSARLEANLLNPDTLLETGWELFPFSFLIDYFVNVGDIISAAVASQRGVVYSSRSIVRTTETRYTASYVNAPAWGEISDPGFRLYHVKRRDVVRDALPLGIPPVVFTLPRSDIRLANIAALLTLLLT